MLSVTQQIDSAFSIQDAEKNFEIKVLNIKDDKVQLCIESSDELEIDEALEKKPKILLVEDNPLVNKINKSFLEALGCLVTVAESGVQATEFFDSSYDLVFLDIGLPDISGVEVCSTMRKMEAGDPVPIVVLTAFGNSFVDECKEAGASDFALKPMPFEQLKEKVTHWLPES